MLDDKHYVKEIIDFLRTCTIFNTFLARQMLVNWLRTEYISTLKPYMHPYYRNLKGDYILKDLSVLEKEYGIYKNELNQAKYEELLRKYRINELAKEYGLTTTTRFGSYEMPNAKIYMRFNTPIMVRSYDKNTDHKIPLTRAVVESGKYPRTIAAYRIPNEGYYQLCAEYPNNVDMIKAVLYPIKEDYDDLENCKNLQFLNCDMNLLEEQERNSFQQTISETLEYILDRWTIKEFTFEDLYSCAHQNLVWLHLFMALFYCRINNIRTHSAHSYHVSAYLKSHGLDDYSSVLTTKQMMFLYRNIDYINKIKGTARAFDILNWGLFHENGMRMTNKMLVQDIVNVVSDCKTSPYVVASDVGKEMFEALQQHPDASYMEKIEIVDRTAGVESDNTVSEVDNGSIESLANLYEKERTAKLEYQEEGMFRKSTGIQTKKFEYMPRTWVRTKLIEIATRHGLSPEEYWGLIYLTNATFYRASLDGLKFNVTISPPDTSYSETITANEAIALALYCVQRIYGMTPSEKPIDRARLAFAYCAEDRKIPKTFTCATNRWLSEFFLTEYGKTSWPHHSEEFYTSDSWSLAADNEVCHFVKVYQECKDSGAAYQTDLASYIDSTHCIDGVYPLDLLEGNTYEQFFNKNQFLQLTIIAYESYPEKTIARYEKLLSEIVHALFPKMTFLASILDGNLDERRKKIKELLISLCSYNIAFIESPFSSGFVGTLSNGTVTVSKRIIKRRMIIDIDTVDIRTIRTYGHEVLVTEAPYHINTY